MSARIVVLSEDIANKIAAGEVVERPASIVKELVENSIDAQADDIQIELVKGGCESIKVIDNGAGIAREDVALVFARHATSKIAEFTDIYQLVSFGFRGEAMPSIASVAQVELLTRRNDDLAGTKALVERGVIKEIAPAGCPTGTQINITGIFANVPARKKFLKTELTEQGACLDAITRLALAHPEIRFRVLVNGRETLALPAAKDISQRINLILGADFSAHSKAFHSLKENISLTGYISRPEYTKSNAKSIFLFVNKRFIRDGMISHAVMSAYRQIIEPRRYPAAVLFIELPPEDIDVNVHPAKMEVRFKDARAIYDLVSRAVAENLTQLETQSDSFTYRLAPRNKFAAAGLRPLRDNSSFLSSDLFPKQETRRESFSNMATVVPPIKEPLPEYSFAPDEKQDLTVPDYLGQFARSYLIFAAADGLILIDQHAAHERLIFEKLKKIMGKKVSSQPLLLPEVVSLSPAQTALFAGSVDWLAEIGLTIEIFGRDTIAVKALPSMLSGVSPREVISDLADQLADQNHQPNLQEKKEKILAALACRAAIKANSVLSGEEAMALYQEWLETPSRITCPHGRPVIVRFSLGEVERMFKRK